MKTILSENDVTPPAGRTGWPWTADLAGAAQWSAQRKHWPRVSIVMPSFNQRDFIEESIRSVLMQGYPDLEFIVYDGGSTDGSVDIIQKYAPWLTFWTSEKDRGQSDAINKGLRRSTGRYFNWQNSDDVLAPGSLFKSALALLEHPEASHVHGYRTAIRADGSFHSSSEQSYGPPSRLAPDAAKSISNLKCGMQPGCLMDKALVDELGGVDERLHFVMDTDILLKLSMIRPAFYLHELIVYYRMHDRTKSHNEWPDSRVYEKLRVVENLFRLKYAKAFGYCRRAALATGHRYAAECFAVSGKATECRKHLLMDIIYAPMSGWSIRKLILYNLKQKQKQLKYSRQADHYGNG